MVDALEFRKNDTHYQIYAVAHDDKGETYRALILANGVKIEMPLTVAGTPESVIDEGFTWLKQQTRKENR